MIPDDAAFPAISIKHDPRDLEFSGVTVRATLLAVGKDGTLVVKTASGVCIGCDWLDAGGPPTVLGAGDALLVILEARGDRGIVLGRIGKYRPPEPAKPEPNVTIEATETLTLKCGEASVDLRKDGKVMVRGEDVLLRAKKTQRIKAGTVAIN